MLLHNKNDLNTQVFFETAKSRKRACARAFCTDLAALADIKKYIYLFCQRLYIRMRSIKCK